MKRPSHRTGKVACQYKRILSSVSTHSNGGRKLHGRSKRKQPDTIELIKLSETICVTIKEGKINQMLQASIVFTLRWVGLRDGKEFEQRASRCGASSISSSGSQFSFGNSPCSLLWTCVLVSVCYSSLTVTLK